MTKGKIMKTLLNHFIFASAFIASFHAVGQEIEAVTATKHNTQLCSNREENCRSIQIANKTNQRSSFEIKSMTGGRWNQFTLSPNEMNSYDCHGCIGEGVIIRFDSDENGGKLIKFGVPWKIFSRNNIFDIMIDR